MKAIIYTKYGSADELRLEEVDKPTPGEDDVLIRVHATSLNASDYEFLTASPAYVRAWGPLKPKHSILGSDIAGRVESVGVNVTRFAPGDDVLGDILGRWGGFAEYVCAPQDALLRKPEGMTFEAAAALPQSASVAVQGLRDEGRVQPGHRVLINGAGGGSGSFSIQIAKHLGAEVTGVDRAEKLDTMRSLGADHVIDYTRQDFTDDGQSYDLIFDLVASHPLLDYRRCLSPRGRYLMVGGSVRSIVKTLVVGSLISLTGTRKMSMLAAKPNEGLPFVIELIEAGKITPVIDARYPLSQVPEAMRYLGAGHARGKIVITMKG